MSSEIKIEDLGYTPFFESGRNKLGLGGFSVARVISESKEAYNVKNAKGEYIAKITGKLMFNAVSREDYPAVGDWVAITDPDDNRAVIQGILPRLTVIKRKYRDKNKAGEKDRTQVIATNIDTAFVVESVDRDYNLNRFERYFAITENSGVKPAIILNKIDLLSREELAERLTQLRNRFPDIDMILTSTVNGEGLDELKRYIIKGKTYCFLGSSGVGKSSLINRLLGENAIKTGDVSSYSGRGKHITTARQMYFLPALRSLGEGEENGPDAAVGTGGIVIDNPGIREVGMTDVNQGIDVFFDEITALAQKCKFTDCTHTREPGCEVLNALKLGKLEEKKYSNYINLKKEAEYHNMNDLEKRKKDRQFGKFIKKAKKDLKGFRQKN